MVRTRIAPSPTGFPHIGTLYQALFDYAWAKRHNGKFIVRIEDTDRTRFVEGAEEALYQALDWIGLQEDESVRKGGDFGPYKQSERLKLYKEHAEQLVKNGCAYRCFCTKERLEEVRKEQQKNKLLPMYDGHCRKLTSEEVSEKLSKGENFVIRMQIPLQIDGKTTITLKDSVRGNIEFDLALIDDQVLMKSDGFPTYHLAVVVDDHLMNISDPLRGEEWIPSWPKHALLYRFFGWEELNYHHSPLLRNPDKSKLAKRQGHTSVSWYQENGILPDALRNFLALTGWSHPEGKEIFSLDEFVSVFDFKDMKAVGPVFDLTKLEWMNGEYIRMMDNVLLAKEIVNFYKGTYSEELIGKVVPLIKERIKTLKEFNDYCRFFIEAPKEYEKDISQDKELLKKIHDDLESVSEDQWKADTVGDVLRKRAEEDKVSIGKFFMIVRIALTGKKITPPINESMEILGKDEVLQRILIAGNQNS